MWELESDLGNYVAHQNYTPPTYRWGLWKEIILIKKMRKLTTSQEGQGPVIPIFCVLSLEHEEPKASHHYVKEQVAVSSRREKQYKASTLGNAVKGRSHKSIIKAEKDLEKFGPIFLLYKWENSQNYFPEIIQSGASRSSATMNSFHSPIISIPLHPPYMPEY